MPTRGYTDPGTRRASHYDPNLSSGYSTNLWKTCPLLEYMFDPMIGVLLDERWQSYDAAATTGDYVGTQATAGTAAISTAAPGVLEVDCNSTTQGQGFQIQRVKSAFIPAANKSIWFECKLKVVDTFDKIQLFAGLSEADTSIIGSGANTSANHIGWEIATAGAGVMTFVSEKAGTRGTVTATTLAEDTYIKLGFFYDGAADTVQQYINGVASGSAVATANIPKVAIYPAFVCQTDDTNDPILHLQGYRVFQLR
jgi:hypothetical protein